MVTLAIVRLPAQSTQLDGRLALTLKRSAIEKRLSPMLIAVMQAILRGTATNPGEWEVDVKFFFSPNELEFTVIADRTNLPLTGVDAAELDKASFIKNLITTMRAINCLYDAKALGQPLKIAHSADDAVRFVRANQTDITIFGPRGTKSAFAGLEALIRRLANGADDIVKIGLDQENFEVTYSRDIPPDASTEQREFAGLITAVDDLTSTIQVTDTSKAPYKTARLHLDKEHRATTIEFQKDKTIVRVNAVVTTRGKKFVSGKILSIAQVDPIAPLPKGNAPSKLLQKKKKNGTRPALKSLPNLRHATMN